MCPKEAMPSDTPNAAGVVLMILAAGAELKQAAAASSFAHQAAAWRNLHFHGV
jgi:hypothetical protein